MYGLVPPVTVISADPSVPPLQLTFVTLTPLLLNAAAGSVIVTLKVWVQPFASFAVTV